MKADTVKKNSFFSKVNNAVASIPLDNMLSSVDKAIEAFEEEEKEAEKEKKEKEATLKANFVSKQNEKGQGKEKEKEDNKENDEKGFTSTALLTLKAVRKILKLLIRWRPVANQTLSSGIETANAVKSSLKQPEIPDEENMNPEVLTEDAPLEDFPENDIDQDFLLMLTQMVEIAVEDNELSPEEEQYLLDFCNEMGVDGSSVIDNIKMSCLINK